MTDLGDFQPLQSGVPGLDALMGGGLPPLSFNIIGGAPGSGKTTCAQQMMFTLADENRRALYFTALGEPPIKMLRYHQRFSFFDVGRINKAIRFINLGSDVASGDFNQVLAWIVEEVQAFSPAYVFVDSFHSIIQRSMTKQDGFSTLQWFTQQLAMVMTGWHATTFLIGEYGPEQMQLNPIFTIADGILWFSQNVCRNSLLRKIQIIKMRGQKQISGLHTFTIDRSGLTIFPRMLPSWDMSYPPAQAEPGTMQRISTGIPAFDDMPGGGLPVGYTMLLVGPSGCAKTCLATEFLVDGASRGESVVIATFEKRLMQMPNVHLQNLIQRGMIHVLTMRSLDLSTDEVLHDLVRTLERTGATRLVFDSLSGFELALASEFRDDFRESLNRLLTALTAHGVSVLMTTELEDRFGEMQFSQYGDAFLVDAIVMQRYVEMEHQLKTIISVVKLRGSAHSRDLRLFCLTEKGIEISHKAIDHENVLGGRPRRST